MSRLPEVPGYHLVDRIARGPRADVWRGTRAADGRVVAVKLPAPGPDAADVELEADRLRGVTHPNLLGLVELVDLPDGGRALVSDYADGGTLADLVQARGRLTTGEAAAVLAPVADALWAVHRRDLVHGDLSPRNIVLTGEGRALLADLGAAQGHGVEEAWGTTGFVAPEVVVGGPATPASDVFGLAAVLVHAVTGRGVLALEAVTDVLARLDDVLPAQLRELVEKMLDGDPGARPRAVEVSRALREHAHPGGVDIGGRAETDLVTYRLREAARTSRSLTRAAHPRTRRHLPEGAARRLARTGGAGALLVAVAVAAWFVGGLLPLGRPAPVVQPVAAVTHPAATTTPPRATSAPTASASAGSAVAVVQGAAASRPRELLTELLAARARAIEDRDPTALAQVDLPGSWAERRDREIVGELVRRGETKQGLAFEVTDTLVESASSTRTLVQASVGTRAHRWTRGATGAAVAATPPLPARYTLRWQDGRWFVERVDPV